MGGIEADLYGGLLRHGGWPAIIRCDGTGRFSRVVRGANESEMGLLVTFQRKPAPRDRLRLGVP
jgi:hypothetical protein